MGRGREGEIWRIKNNMSGDDYVVVVGGEIKTLVAFVISEVSEENTYGGPVFHFVSGFSREIGITGTIEHAQVLIGGGDSMEDDVWISRADHLGGEAVQQICASVEPFYLVVSRNRRMKEQRMYHIIDGAMNVLSFTVLWRSVWTRHL
jgi:hypothetical protein